VDVHAYGNGLDLTIGRCHTRHQRPGNLGHQHRARWHLPPAGGGAQWYRWYCCRGDPRPDRQQQRRWHGGRITQDQTWSADQVNVVDSTVVVAAGVRLTIAPGAIVKFAHGAGLTLEASAILDAQATAAKPIVLTSLADDSVGGDTNLDGSASRPLAGDWIWRADNAAQTNLTQYVTLRYQSQEHSGTLPTDQLWAGGVYHHVSSEVVVPSGMTLTISARRHHQVRRRRGPDRCQRRAPDCRRHAGPAHHLHLSERRQRRRRQQRRWRPNLSCSR